MSRYITYYYYTWQEFLNASINDGNPVNPFDDERLNLIKLPNIASSVGLGDTGIKKILINGVEDDTFYKLLYGKYYGSAIIKTTNDYTESGLDYNDEVKEWVAKMIVKMLETQDKYITLLDFYAKEKEKLLSPIKSSINISNQGNRNSSMESSGTSDLTAKTTDVGELKTTTSGSTNSYKTSDTDVNNYDLPSNAYDSQSPSGFDADFVSQMQENVSEENSNSSENSTSTQNNNSSSSNTQHNADASTSTQTSSDTTTTNQVNEDDRESKIRRLNEIDVMYKNTLKDWVGEFSRLFYEEINY